MARKVGRTLAWVTTIVSISLITGAVVAFKAFENMDVHLEWPDLDDEV